MNIFKIFILFEIAYILICILYLFLLIFDAIFLILFGIDPSFKVPIKFSYNGFKTILQTIIDKLMIPAIIILAIFIVFYVIYIIITRIFPEFIFLIIPIRKMLLSIDPLPDLIATKIFDLFDSIFYLFNTDYSNDKLLYLGETLGSFMKTNTKFLLNELYPNLENDLASYANNYNLNVGGNGNDNPNPNSNNPNKINNKSKYNPDDKPKDKPKEDEQSIKIKRLIEEEKQYCINKGIITITPSMNSIDKMYANAKNSELKFKCTIDSIQSYIKANYAPN